MPALENLIPHTLLNKRLLGFLSWRWKRQFQYGQAPLIAFRNYLQTHRPDHLLLTGDLTNLGLPQEYRAVTAFLKTLLPSEELSVVPGNHDAYVSASLENLGDWQAFFTGDDGKIWPFLRRRGPVSFIGISTAYASPPFWASGRISHPDLTRLSQLLVQERRRLRVVFLHHPPSQGRRGLVNSEKFLRVLHENGAEILLHGHWHRARFIDGNPLIFGAPALGSTQTMSAKTAGFWQFSVLEREATWELTAELLRWQSNHWIVVEMIQKILIKSD